MSTLELCEKYFDTRDVYQLFESEKTASAADLKKAYYKLSLQVHPDRVDESEKEIATEKFKILSKLYQTLADKDKRALYDEQGIIDDDDEGDLDGKLTSWLDLWKKIFKPITEEQIVNYEKDYINSELERSDIKKAYLNGKGCLNIMLNAVPFLKVEDEPRVREIVQAMIDAEEVPEYEQFINEPAQKRKRRHQKYARESKEAAEIKKKINAKSKDMSLEQQIMARHKSRAGGFDALMDNLLAKYGNEDDEDVFELEDLGKRKSKKKVKVAASKKSTPTKGNIHAVKNGKVNKRKN